MKKVVKKAELDEEVEELEARVYELGFHLVPDFSEEDALKEFNIVKSFLIEQGGDVIGEGAPKLLNLAYSIAKTVKAVKTTYHKAYFSWVKFETSPEILPAVKVALDESPIVLRYLMVTSTKAPVVVAKETEDTKDEKAVEEVDKEIEALVIA